MESKELSNKLIELKGKLPKFLIRRIANHSCISIVTVKRALSGNIENMKFSTIEKIINTAESEYSDYQKRLGNMNDKVNNILK